MIDLIKKMTFEQNLKESERVNYVDDRKKKLLEQRP